MSITATGPLFALLAIYVFCFKPTQLAYFAAFFAPFSATAVVNLSGLSYKATGLGLTPAMLFILLFFGSQLVFGYLARPVRISVAHLVQLALIALFVISTLASIMANSSLYPSSSSQVTQTIYLMIGLAAAVLLSLEFVHGDGIDRVIRVVRAAAVFVSLWGLLQLGCSLLRIPYPSMLFNNSNSDAADMFAQQADGGAFARIASVAVEPSVMAASLLHFAVLGATLIAFDRRFRTKAWLIPTGLALFVLLISTSSTAYVGLAVLGFLIFLERPLIALAYGIPLLLVAAAMILAFPVLGDVLLGATIHKSDSFSYMDRTATAARDLVEFYKRPLLGYGWGTASNFNAITTMLCNDGIIGTVLFLICGTYTLASLYIASHDADDANWKLAAYAAGVKNALIVAAVCAITSGIKYVFLDDFVFWGLGIAIVSRLGLAMVPVPRKAVTPRSRHHAAIVTT